VLYLHRQTIAGAGIAWVYLHYQVGLVMNTCVESLPPTPVKWLWHDTGWDVTHCVNSQQEVTPQPATELLAWRSHRLLPNHAVGEIIPHQRHIASIATMKVSLPRLYVAISDSWADWLASRVPRTGHRHS
jgi:hypothetical protein